MLRKTFETEIKQVKDDVLILGSMVEQSILGSVEGLKKRDLKAAQEDLGRRPCDQQKALRDRKPVDDLDCHSTTDGARSASTGLDLGSHLGIGAHG